MSRTMAKAAVRSSCEEISQQLCNRDCNGLGERRASHSKSSSSKSEEDMAKVAVESGEISQQEVVPVEGVRSRRRISIRNWTSTCPRITKDARIHTFSEAI